MKAKSSVIYSVSYWVSGSLTGKEQYTGVQRAYIRRYTQAGGSEARWPAAAIISFTMNAFLTETVVSAPI